MNRLVGIFLAVLLLLSAPAWSGEPGSGLQFSPVVRMLGGLGLVLGLILGGYGLLRNRLGSLPAGRKRAIRLIESCPLGPRKSVCLVRVRDREYLLGVTQQQISLLGECSSKSVDENPEVVESFGNIFSSMRRKEGK